MNLLDATFRFSIRFFLVFHTMCQKTKPVTLCECVRASFFSVLIQRNVVLNQHLWHAFYVVCITVTASTAHGALSFVWMVNL